MIEKKSVINENNDNSIQNKDVETAFHKYFQTQGFDYKKPALAKETSQNLTIVNSTIAPYIPTIHPEARYEFNDYTIQPCVRMNSVNNKTGLLIKKHYTTLFDMCGVISTKSDCKEIVKMCLGYIAEQLDTDRLYFTVPEKNQILSDSLIEAGVSEDRCFIKNSNTDDYWINWQFDIPGPTGNGITFFYDILPDNTSEIDIENSARFVEFLNVINIQQHYDGLVYKPLPKQITEIAFGAQKLKSLKNDFVASSNEPYSLIREAIIKDHIIDTEEYSLKVATIIDHIVTAKFLFDSGLKPGK